MGEYEIYGKPTQTIKRKQRGFTDRMYLYNVKFVTWIVIFSFVLMFISVFHSVDTSPLAVIVPAAFAELGLHTAFLVWKAKAENINKHPNIIKQMQEVDSYASTNS